MSAKLSRFVNRWLFAVIFLGSSALSLLVYASLILRNGFKDSGPAIMLVFVAIGMIAMFIWEIKQNIAVDKAEKKLDEVLNKH